MRDWRQFFQGWASREDQKKELYPGRWELEKPLFINEAGPVVAAFIGARVLRALALRGGTRVMPSALERLEGLARRALPKEVVAHLEAEAVRILAWIEERPTQEDALLSNSQTPELDMMVASDLESRLSVARFALDEGYDLELEYFDRDQELWSRGRVILEGIEQEEDLSWALRLREQGRQWSLSLQYVRWLMPVNLTDAEKKEPPPGGEVVPFPGRRGDD